MEALRAASLVGRQVVQQVVQQVALRAASLVGRRAATQEVLPVATLVALPGA